MFTPAQSQDERRTNFILKNADIYNVDAGFRKMVDETVYLTREEKTKSAIYVDDYYGVNTHLDYIISGRDDA